MQSTLPKSLIYLVLIGAIAAIGLLILPYAIPLDGEEGNPWLAFIGRFHIVVLHLPIGWLLIVPILAYLSRKKLTDELDNLIHYAWCFVALSAIVTVGFGMTLASSDGYSGKMVTDHLWMAVTTSIFIIICLVTHRAHQLLRHKVIKNFYWISVSAAIISVSMTGHLGGNLVQGEDYLYEKLPSSLKITLGLQQPKPVIDFDTPIYQGFIDPIFAQTCMSCHSEKKVKGKFKLDTLDALFKGGSSKKPAIVRGNIEKSQLIHRISLPSNDDKAMPPEGRTPLTAEQIRLIQWWVEIGAPADMTINDLSSDQLPVEIERIVEVIIVTNQQEGADTYQNVESEQLEKSITRLKTEFGLSITPVSQLPKDGLHVSAFNVNKNFDKQAWEAMTLLAPYIRSADLARVSLNQQDLQGIATYTQLESLKLNGVSLSGLSLAPLSQLKRLKILNLFGTDIDDASVAELSKLKSLKRLYLSQTNISSAGITELQTHLKRATITHQPLEVAKDSL